MAAFYFKKTLLSIIAVLLFIGQFARAQEAGNSTTVNGKVFDNFGKPLANVVVNTSNGLSTVTNESGDFSITAPLKSLLLFSHPLFNTQEVVAGKSSTVAIRLSERFLHHLKPAGETVNLSDSVVAQQRATQKINVLYGEKNADEMIGSYSTAYRNQLSTTPAPNYLYSLAGRLPGLNVIQNSGFRTPLTTSLTDVDIFVGNIPRNNSGAGPTDNTEFTLQLRGHAGSAGQAPLTVIDGVQREFYSLDPESIESVTIAKDALSSILLGQNSSKGALIVTTRRPQAGAPHLSYTAETGFQSSLGLQTPLPAYQYAYLLNEALLNGGQQPAYTAADFTAYRNGTDPLGHPNVNWYDVITRKNPVLTSHNLNVTGGGSLARYVVSLNYMNQQGMFVTDPNNSYNTNQQLKRYLINSKVEIDINKNFNVGLQLFGRLQEGNQPGAGTQTILSGLLSTPNNAYPVYNPNRSFGGSNNYTQNLLAQTIGSGYIADNSRDIMANLDLKYKLDDYLKGWWVSAKGNISVSSSSILNRNKQSPVFSQAVSTTGETTYNRFGSTINQQNVFTTTAWSRYWFAQLATGYDRQFGQHKVSGMLLYDQKKTLLNYDIPANLTNYSGKVDYSYGGRYFAEAAVVYGGYDRYQPGHQYGLFYAGGIGWDLAKENFLRGQHWLQQLKLRATYGKTGNANVDNYGYYVWRSYFTGVAGWYPVGSTYPNGVGLAENGTPGNQTLANVTATWEKANKLDIGLDVSMLKNHLQLTADYYNERYYDVLQQRGRTIALIGINYPAENIGINRFDGGELSLTYQNKLNNFNYFITANAAVQQTKVLYKDEQTRSYPWNVETGRPVGQRFGLIADGFFGTDAEAKSSPTITGYTPLAGDFRYRDLNNDGIIDQFDLTALGKQRPLIYYGLTFGFDCKGLEFSTLIQGVQNRENYVNNGYVDAGFQGQNNGYSQSYQQALGRWIPENATGALYPRLTAGGNGYNYNPLFSSNSYFLKNGNYFRLKNIHLGYSLPYKWLSRLKVGNIKVFVEAQNLYTWAAYGITDPEVALPNYPIQRVINTGVTIKL